MPKRLTELTRPVTDIPTKLGNFTLHNEAGLLQRRTFIDHNVLVRGLHSLSAKEIAPRLESLIRTVGDPSKSNNLDYFERSMKFRNAERFEQPAMKSAIVVEEVFETQMNQFLLQHVKDFGNRPGDLIKSYQDVLGIYLREIQYYSALGQNGLGAVQQLISEMVNFGLRGPVMTQLTNLQAGEKAKQDDEEPQQGASKMQLDEYFLKKSTGKLTDQGIKDTDLYDMGTLDQLMVAVIAVQEVGKPFKQNGVFRWISSCRDNKPKPDDLMFVDFSLRMATATKGVLYGQEYFDNDSIVLAESVNALNSLNVANESLASHVKDEAKETIGQELINIVLLNPQLLIKFSAMFGQYADQVGEGEMARQLLKQMVRDDEFPALAEPGETAHLLHKDGVDIASLLKFAGECFKTPIFTVGNKGANYRTTYSTELSIFREMTNALFQLKDPTIPSGDAGKLELKKRKDRRDRVFPLSVAATRTIAESRDFKAKDILGAQMVAGKHIERFGKNVVGEMSKLLFDKASGIIGTAATSEAKQAVADELLVQLMINTVFVSPDSFMPAETLKKLRKDFGKRVVETYNLLMADNVVSAKSSMILSTIFQYMYQHWDVSEITDVVNCYKTDTVGNSNAAAYTNGRLRTFALNLLLPDAEQHIDYNEEKKKKQEELFPVMRSLVGDIAAKMPVWFGRSGGKELIASVFTGTDEIEATLMHEWDLIVVEGQPDGESGRGRTYPALYKSNAQVDRRYTGFTTERAASMTGTIDILTQLINIADFLPSEMEIPDPTAVKAAVVEPKPVAAVVSKSTGILEADMIQLDQPRPIPKVSREIEKAQEVKKIKVRPQEDFATTIMAPLIQPILDIYAEFTGRKANDFFVEEIAQVTQLGSAAAANAVRVEADIDQHTAEQQKHAKVVAGAKSAMLKQIRLIMKEEGLARGLDDNVLKLITEQSELIKAQAGTPALTSGAGVPGMGTALIMAPAAQNEGLNAILKAIADQSGANINHLRDLVQQLRIDFADVIVDQAAYERESAWVTAYKEQHEGELRWFKQAADTAGAYEGQRQEILRFVQRVAAEKDVTIAKLLRQFYDAGFTHLVEWYVAAQNPRAKAKKKEEVV